MSDDTKEFMNEASKYKPSLGRTQHAEIAKNEDCGCDEPAPPRLKKRKTGGYSQYIINGQYFMPAAYGVDELTSAVYGIESTEEGPVFIRRDISTDTIIRFPESNSDQLVKEIGEYWNLKDEFKNGNSKAVGGYLQKRGYMLYGPPGSGKTCTIHLIMQGIIERGGVVLLGDCSPKLLSKAVQRFREIQNDTPIVIILEDIDSLLHDYREADYLSLLDGEHSVNNVLIIATTNYPSRLNPRIYNRPGRFSRIVRIDMPSTETRRLFLQTKLKDPMDVEKIVEMTSGFSLDHLKFLILSVYFEGKNLDEEVERLRDMFQRPIDEIEEGRKLGIG
jgi:AAA+ superfamily predicted ATPase